jgi:beta-glucanase (GH16 family)
MGNLGRVGYGGTLEGTWPYSYDSCDVGTLANQTLNGEPAANLHNGLDQSVDYALSYLSGQRLSACTCPDDETHPGPKMTDGSFRGRSAPEIDVIEAQVHDGVGEVSLSAQWAPFDAYYEWNNVTYSTVEDPAKAYLNTYKGGPFQQTSSYVGITNQECYQYPLSGAAEGCFAVYAFEYKLGKDGYIKWFNDDELAWTYLEGGLGPNPASGVGNRPIPYEPMYIIFNLAISLNFGAINFEGLEPMWPMKMEVDYVRLSPCSRCHRLTGRRADLSLLRLSPGPRLSGPERDPHRL